MTYLVYCHHSYIHLNAPKLKAYADDMAIQVTEKFLGAISNEMDNALRIIHR